MLFDHEINKSLLREVIADCEIDEIPRTGRVYLQSTPKDYLSMRDLAIECFDSLLKFEQLKK